jgi:hypothetical protein
MMKKVAVSLLAALTLSAGVPAFAQNGAAKPAAAAPSAASQASVRALLDAMHYRETITASNKLMSDNVVSMLRAQVDNAVRNNPKLDDAGRKAEMAKLEKRLPKATAAMQAVLSDPKLVDELYNEALTLYARYFTAQEMDQLAAFYRTPTGQKTLNVMPQLTMEAAKMGQRVVGPRMQAALKQANE